jgi:hypothetical protein
MELSSSNARKKVSAINDVTRWWRQWGGGGRLQFELIILLGLTSLPIKGETRGPPLLFNSVTDGLAVLVKKSSWWGVAQWVNSSHSREDDTIFLL